MMNRGSRIAKKAGPKGRPGPTAGITSRIVRKVADGLIQVYFEDMTTPAMTAQDKTFGHGSIGLRLAR